MSNIEQLHGIPEGVDPNAAVIADLAINAGHAQLEAKNVDRGGLALIPKGVGQAPELVDLDEDYGTTPVRHRGTVQLSTVDSLLGYLTEHATDATTVWVHPTNGHVEAVLDDHTLDDPGWGEHRAHLKLEPSPAWQAWTGINGRLLPQIEFAEHVEDNLPDIQVPDAATLLDVAQTLTGRTDVEWKSGLRLDDGTVQMKYVETGAASAGVNGDLEIPTAFVLALAPFRGEDRVDVHGRLRWRARGGTLAIGIRLDRPEDVVDAAIEKVRARLAEGRDHVYVGTPRPR